MWNSEAPLKLLISMPSYLTLENLKNIQKIIDDDKFINSKQYHRDLCGLYAPFCENCDKKVIYPCAVAYVKMKQAEGMEVEIAVALDEPEEEVEEVVEEPQVIEEPVVETAEKPASKRIRIAIAKRKH